MQTLSGIVVSVKTAQTAKVEVTRRWTHPVYHKTVSRRKSYLAHCDIPIKEGDKVILVPTRPISKLKKWKVSKKI